MKKPTQLNGATGMPSKGALCASRLEGCDDDEAKQRAVPTRPGLWDKSDRTLDCSTTKADVANLKTRMVSLLPVVGLLVGGTGGVILAAAMTG